MNLLYRLAMILPFIKSKRILIPDVPPPRARKSEQRLVIAGIGFLCTTVVILGVLLVFLGG